MMFTSLRLAQNVCVEGSPVSAPEGPQVLDRLNRLAGCCHEVGIQVIHTAHVVRPDHNNMGILGDILPPVQAGLIDDGSVPGDLHAGFRSDGTATFGLPDVGLGAITAQDVQCVTCSVMSFFFGQVLTVGQAVEKIRTQQ
jgi:hypothetical protein